MNILTFDIEDWFHLLDHAPTDQVAAWTGFESRIDRNLDLILELLSERSLNATFFCLGWMAEAHPTAVRRIVDAGHEIGSHSYAHELIYRQSRAEFEADLRRSLDILQDTTGQRIRAYRAPGFSLTSEVAWAFEVLMECGIEIDCSVFPAQRNHGGFQSFGAAEPVILTKADVELKAFPINLMRILGRSVIFTGGGYFRVLPYSVIVALMHRSRYVMTYFHPRDFDPDQPVLPGLPLKRRFMSYVGLETTHRKLRQLLSDFNFVDLDQAVALTDWTGAPRLSVDALTANGGFVGDR